QEKHESIFATVNESADRLEQLRQLKDGLAQGRDDARAEVRGFTRRDAEQAAGAGGQQSVATVPLQFTEDQMACLNQVGDWLPSTVTGTGASPLGQVMRTARRENSKQSRGKSDIGVPGGLEAAVAEGEQLLEACRALEASTAGAADAYRACAAALQAYKALEEQEKAAMVTFFRRLEQKDDEGRALIDALNEFLSLFKPAPWAYAGLTLEAVKRSGD